MSGQQATESRGQIASCLKKLEQTLDKPTGSGGDPHGADHYNQQGGGQKGQGKSK